MKKKSILFLTILFCASGAYTEGITIFDSNSVIVEGDIYDTVVVKGDGTVVAMTGGSVVSLKTMNASTFDMSGGDIGTIYSYDSSVCNLSGGTIDYMNSYTQSNVNISGDATVLDAYFYGPPIVTVSSANAYVGLLKLFKGSILNFSAGSINDIYIHQNSELNMSGGTIISRIAASVNRASISRMNISGGTIPSIGIAEGASVMTISGGTISEISVSFYNYPHDISRLNIVGYDLIANPYDGIYEYGQIRGFWNDSTFFVIDLRSPETYGSVVLYDGIVPVQCTNRPDGDISGDCKVDMADLSRLAAEWLKDGNE